MTKPSAFKECQFLEHVAGLVIEASEPSKVLFPFMGHVFSAESVSEQSTEVLLNFPARQACPEQQAVLPLNTPAMDSYGLLVLPPRAPQKGVEKNKLIVRANYLFKKTSTKELKVVHPNVSQGCQGGCATCSDYNGCLSCKPRLFFVLERIGMKQIGVCLSSCPSGYYGTRYPDINKCAKCKADCDTCFTRNFCTKCKSGFYLYSGKCLEKCPDGLEANNHTMECTSIVHCETSEWSPWSPCMKKGKTCGFKRGNEVRVKEIIQHPSARGNPCPATTESRKCIVQRKRCQKEGKVYSRNKRERNAF
ncbi:hypothetical protein EK904_009877, partial [Melospiza melodia maxima]